jgi:hypothetical protein
LLGLAGQRSAVLIAAHVDKQVTISSLYTGDNDVNIEDMHGCMYVLRPVKREAWIMYPSCTSLCCTDTGGVKPVVHVFYSQARMLYIYAELPATWLKFGK